MDDSHVLTGTPDEPRRSGNGGVVRPRNRPGRTTKACTQCHGRKQKCDGLRPCRNCIVRRVESSCRPFTQTDLSEQPSSRHKKRWSRESRPKPSSRSELQSSANAGSTNEAFVSAGGTGATNDDPVPHLGQLWRSRGAPSFFGSSYFGPQVAAALLDTAAPYVQPGANLSRRSESVRPFRDEDGPFSQLWDLLGLLPRQRSTVDRLVNRFFDQINEDIDAVHQQSFNREYQRFYSRKAGLDDVTTVDIRWLALLFIILAFGTLLDCPHNARPEVQREYEESSMSLFWACRKAIVIAPSFYGESTDLVRAGILVTRFCIFSQRITESWLTVGFAARLAMAQGLHIDGTYWKLPRRETESRRRLWCQLYLLDRMISLALGRPYCITDSLSLAHEPENVFLDDVDDDAAETVQPKSLADSPTPSVVAIFSYRLAKVIGQIHEQTCGLRAVSYGQVMALDAQLLEWKRSLPLYLLMERSDKSRDQTQRFLQWHRLYLHTSYHFACITLHRPFAWRTSVTDQYRYSREACFNAACADMKTRLEHNETSDSIDHSSWCLGVPQLFNSAIVLGMLAIQEQSRGSYDSQAIINDLQSFCDKEFSEIWVNEFRLAEVKVIELCIDRLKNGPKPKGAPLPAATRSPSSSRLGERRRKRQTPKADLVAAPEQLVPLDEMDTTEAPAGVSVQNSDHQLKEFTIDPGDLGLGGCVSTQLTRTFSEPFSFPGPSDLEMWQDMIDAIDHQADGDILREA